MQCNYNSFIQIINFHGLFRNPLRCRKTGASRILVPLRYMPMVMRGLTLTVPSLVNPIDLLHIYMPIDGNERVNPHSTKPCKPHWLTTHLHAYRWNERVNPHSTKPCKPHWLTTHLHAYGNERVNPHSTKPCKPIDLLHIYMPMVMRGLTLTVSSLVNPIDLLHIYSGGSRGGGNRRPPPKKKNWIDWFFITHFVSECFKMGLR